MVILAIKPSTHNVVITLLPANTIRSCLFKCGILELKVAFLIAMSIFFGMFVQFYYKYDQSLSYSFSKKLNDSLLKSQFVAES